MAKINLASMSVEALLRLRDDVGHALDRKAGELQISLQRSAPTLAAVAGVVAAP